MSEFDLEAAFEAAGIRMGCRGYLEDRDCYYRVVRGEVQVGMKASFDRFANGVDYVFAACRTQEEFDAAIDRLKSAVAAGRHNPMLGMEIRL